MYNKPQPTPNLVACCNQPVCGLSQPTCNQPVCVAPSLRVCQAGPVRHSRFTFLATPGTQPPGSQFNHLQMTQLSSQSGGLSDAADNSLASRALDTSQVRWRPLRRQADHEADRQPCRSCGGEETQDCSCAPWHYVPEQQNPRCLLLQAATLACIPSHLQLSSMN